MITLKQLELGLVRAAERQPDRVGPQGILRNLHGGRCIVGQACFDAGVDAAGWSLARRILTDGASRPIASVADDFVPLARLAAKLNDGGLSWREVVLALGLIHPEFPADPIEVPETEEVACV